MYNTYTERFIGDSGTNIMVSVKQQCPNVVSILIIPLQHWYDWKYICFSCLLTAFVSHKMLFLLVADIQNQTILKKLLHFLKSNSNIAENTKNWEKQINFENITRIVFQYWVQLNVYVIILYCCRITPWKKINCLKK